MYINTLYRSMGFMSVNRGGASESKKSKKSKKSSSSGKKRELPPRDSKGRFIKSK